jgi:hypothetical protein
MFHKLYSSNIVIWLKPWIITWVGHIPRRVKLTVLIRARGWELKDKSSFEMQGLKVENGLNWVSIKVKLSPCFFLNWAPRHEGVLWEWRYSCTHSLTSALDGGEWSASRSSGFTPRERVSDTHWIGGWVGPRAVLDTVVKKKIPSHRRESNPKTPIVKPVAWSLYRLSYHGSNWVSTGYNIRILKTR